MPQRSPAWLRSEFPAVVHPMLLQGTVCDSHGTAHEWWLEVKLMALGSSAPPEALTVQCQSSDPFHYHLGRGGRLSMGNAYADPESTLAAASSNQIRTATRNVEFSAASMVCPEWRPQPQTCLCHTLITCSASIPRPGMSGLKRHRAHIWQSGTHPFWTSDLTLHKSVCHCSRRRRQGLEDGPIPPDGATRPRSACLTGTRSSMLVSRNPRRSCPA